MSTVQDPGHAGPQSGAQADPYRQAQDSEQFSDLRRRFRGWVFPMTVAFLVWYLLYVILSGYARDFMGQRLLGNINVALVFGLLQFVTTFLIAWLYERHMTKNVDPIADRMLHEVEGGDTQ